MEILTGHTNLDRQDLLDVFSAKSGSIAAIIYVRGALINENRILLVLKRSDGLFFLPEGLADEGEFSSEMVKRDGLEESGFIVKPVKVIGVFDDNREG